MKYKILIVDTADKVQIDSVTEKTMKEGLTSLGNLFRMYADVNEIKITPNMEVQFIGFDYVGILREIEDSQEVSASI